MLPLLACVLSFDFSVNYDSVPMYTLLFSIILLLLMIFPCGPMGFSCTPSEWMKLKVN